MLAKIAKFFKVIIPALVLGVGFSYLISFAQIPPPPQNNPFPPINTTATDQIKQFANGAGFLGLDYLKDPAPPTTNWGKKAGPSTLCSDPSGKIIICRTYVAPTASLTIQALNTTIEPDLVAGVDEENNTTYTYREFGLSNIARFGWTVTKNTNMIDTAAAKSINFSTSTTGASIDVSDTDSIPDTNNTATSSTNILATGLTQSGSIIDDTNNYSAPNVDSTFSVSAYDVSYLGSGGLVPALANATIYWRHKIYCGRSAVDYANPATGSSFTYADLTQNFNGLYQKLSAGFLPCVFNFSSTPQYAYFLVPDNFVATKVNQLDPNNTNVIIGPIGLTNVQLSPYQDPVPQFGRRVISLTNKFGYTRNYHIYRSPELYWGGSKAFKPVP